MRRDGGVVGGGSTGGTIRAGSTWWGSGLCVDVGDGRARWMGLHWSYGPGIVAAWG